LDRGGARVTLSVVHPSLARLPLASWLSTPRTSPAARSSVVIDAVTNDVAAHSPAPAISAASLRALCAGTFLLVFGSHAWVIARFGSWLPFWDQWDAEAFGLYIPWFDGTLTWARLAEAHNEHRVLLTKLVDLVLVVLNGEWDARLQTVVSAALHAWWAVLLVRWSVPYLGARVRVPIAIAIAFVCALPIGGENVLGGFQIQVFLLLLVSLHAVHGVSARAPFSRGAWMGIASAVLALGTMASGFTAAAAGFAVLVLRARRETARRAALLGQATILLAIVGAGWLLRVRVAHHESLAAHGLGEFLDTFVRAAAWPLPAARWPALVFLLPWTWVLVRAFRARRALEPFECWLIGAGVWSLLQLAAIAVARGGGEPFPPRYAHLFCVSHLVNLIALGWLATSFTERRSRVRLALVAAAWLAVLAVGLTKIASWELETALPRWRDAMRAYETSYVAYVERGDESALDGKIPYPDRARLKSALDAPEIRAILPTGRAPLSRAADFAARAGAWLAAAGAAILAAVFVQRLAAWCGARRLR
jgi:hypothetical protein